MYELNAYAEHCKRSLGTTVNETLLPKRDTLSTFPLTHPDPPSDPPLAAAAQERHAGNADGTHPSAHGRGTLPTPTVGFRSNRGIVWTMRTLTRCIYR
eukprot:1191358-Prorocentrum_minimum.AAC.1